MCFPNPLGRGRVSARRLRLSPNGFEGESCGVANAHGEQEGCLGRV